MAVWIIESELTESASFKMVIRNRSTKTAVETIGAGRQFADSAVNVFFDFVKGREAAPSWHRWSESEP